MRIKKEFFERGAEIVARELVGKVIVRQVKGKEFFARITESEAYFDKEDPASWARFNGDCRETMGMKAGTMLVKKVHNNWLFNIVTGMEGEYQAVLLRGALGINFNLNCGGPGLLTRALLIDKRFHKKSILFNKEIKIIDDGYSGFKVHSGKRIGVKKDLKKPYRFFNGK